MGQRERSLSALGKRVAEEQDAAPEARLDRERGRARLLREPAPKARSMPRSARFIVALAAALSLVALALLLRPRAPLRFQAAGTEGLLGAWIAAPPEAALPIAFSDGSRLELSPGGRARVASVSADGAEIALERGSLDLSVVHRARTRWLVRVGPFQVNVIGTRFEASWDPVSERFVVSLREGAITVSGPIVGEARAVRAGERLSVSTAAGTLETSALDAPARPASSAAEVIEREPAPAPLDAKPAAPSARPREPEPARATPSARSSAPIPASTWRALALDGKYQEALAAAEREGFDALCASANAGDLHALADAARLGGDAARAAQAFGALRARFPGSPEAADAAFILGRIAQDRRRDHAGAARWFASYLREQPGGAFAAEAAGRIIEARDRTGDSEGAHAAAERYLERYPSGPYAGYARRVLDRDRDRDRGAAPDAGAP